MGLEDPAMIVNLCGCTGVEKIIIHTFWRGPGVTTLIGSSSYPPEVKGQMVDTQGSADMGQWGQLGG